MLPSVAPLEPLEPSEPVELPEPVEPLNSVADGKDHRLDPRVIPLQRIGGFIFTAFLALGSLVGIGIALIASDGESSTRWIVLPGAWLVAVLLLSWHTWRWPPRAYAFTSYRVDDQGIEIRKGVFWRVVINVPRSRVQHIDVAQGPVERRYGLGTLVIYTAGTDHAKVDLEGLEHGRALAIREHLLPSGSGDAV
jgi:membrane protein YdbS with pleckstrin-like domain